MISLKNIKKFIFQIEIIPVSDFQLHLASFLSGKDCSDKNVVENVHHDGRATTENIYQFHSNYADFTVQRNENQEKQQQQQQQQQQQKKQKRNK